MRPVKDVADEERTDPRLLEEPIPVGLEPGRLSGMEIGGSSPKGEDPQVIREESVQGAEKDVHPEMGRDLKVCDLAFGMDAGVGPARAVDGD
jgi:hypothetical protein